MTHELKRIIKAYLKAKDKGIKTVMATVVALDGSSYRRPGVRMLMNSEGLFTGAVSGGCVEKEIWRQAQEVFTSGTPRIMTYDGRYRLGCEGILYILIEPFMPDDEFITSFWKTISERKGINCRIYRAKDEKDYLKMGTHFYFGNGFKGVRPGLQQEEGLKFFEQQLMPSHQLLIIGAEHDAVQLSTYGSMTGWEVSIITSPSEEKNIKDFPGAKELLAVSADDFDVSKIDTETSVVIMTHSYVKDLSFLMALSKTLPRYLGLLGPTARREKILNELLERCPDINPDFIENIHGPAGLDIGAETAGEIAVSIVAEILSVYRNTHPKYLKDKKGAIHYS
ncbi:MAG: XdhC family protein [Flavobacteriaceae bacterium]